MLRDVCGNVAGVEGRKSRGQARGKKLVSVFVRDARPIAAEVSKAAPADMQFRRQNPDESQSGPLAPTEVGKELLARVMEGGLYAIDGGSGQWIFSDSI